MTNLLLTFDYEPFFNDGNLNLKETLIKPTHRILNHLSSKSRNIFFIDATFLLFLKKNQLQEEFNLISQQVKEIVSLGNEIGLHIHPHWDEAKFENNMVCHNFEKFALVDFGEDRNKIIENSFEILQDIACECKITSFRAGGLILSGWSSFEKLLWQLGVVEDHSIVPRFQGKNAGRLIDYSSCELSEPDGICEFLVDEEVSTAMFEYPITCYHKTIPMKLIDTLLRRKFSTDLRLQPKPNGLDSTLAQCDYRYLTCDFIHPLMFKKILRAQRNARYLSFINHPKDFTSSTIENIRAIYETF